MALICCFTITGGNNRHITGSPGAGIDPGTSGVLSPFIGWLPKTVNQQLPYYWQPGGRPYLQNIYGYAAVKRHHLIAS
eukprot:9734691-Ditylum_brightwellii.AAC.1